jgi:hypothetical protein
MFELLFPLTINNIKNNFIKHVMKRESTFEVNRILNYYPEIQTPNELYNYLRQLPFNSPEQKVFENAYDEYIANL